MYQQVIPLLTDFKDVLSGKQSLFFNLNNAGGMNFWGVFFFFIASPFSLLVVFFKKTEIVYLVNILIVLKLAMSAFTSSLYLKKHFKGKLDDLSVIVLSVSYGLCGYGLLYFQNNIWLDEMYLLPLLLLSGCNDDRLQNAFCENGGVRLLVGGRIAFTYEPNTCQLAFSRAQKEFRAHTDNMSDFFVVDFSDIPANEGQSLTADLVWTTEREVLTRKNLTLTVVRSEGDQFWLWSNAGRIGLVVRILE
jgi:hypothetical protein